MLMLPAQTKILLSRDPVDMRKSINGLSILVTHVLKKDPKQAALFVFFNRNRKKVKVLYWDRTGFALWYKSLSDGRYRLPELSKPVENLSVSDLTCLLEGIDLLDSKRHQVI